MYVGKLLLAQVMDHLPLHTFSPNREPLCGRTEGEVVLVPGSNSCAGRSHS